MVEPVVVSIASGISETIVSSNGSNVSVKLGIQEVKRMAHKQKGKEGAGVVNEMLHRVHRQTSPRSWIITLVVNTVNPSVQERSQISLSKTILWIPPRVNESVDPIEMEFSPISHKHKNSNRIDGPAPKVRIIRKFSTSPCVHHENLEEARLDESKGGEQNLSLKISSWRSNKWSFLPLFSVWILGVIFLGAQIANSKIRRIGDVMPKTKKDKFDGQIK
jgi:hypothetical protein